MKTLGSGVRQTINYSDIGNSFFFEPSQEEQAKIAAFLDHETAKIDTLIDKQQQLIKLLKEKRQAVISHAVTKGLNPDAPMRDSGVEWLGEVPEHWDVKKISHISVMRSGDGIVSEQIKIDGHYPVYGGNGLRGYFDKFNHDGSYVLIGRQGALCGNINYGHGKFWASEHAIVIYLQNNIQHRWFGETLRAMNLNQYSVSAAQPGLSVANITCLKVPFPPKEERTAIEKHIEQQTRKIDILVSKALSVIELLQERRTALISAAVTGKIDVRNFKVEESHAA
jgi:type I restriction enzyme S subunit